MSNWKEVVEDGKVFYVNDDYGNVLKLSDGVYWSMMAKVIKLGPFETLEQAKQVLEQDNGAVDQVLDNFNHNLVLLSRQVKED